MRKVVAGNWKMNTLVSEGVALAKGVVELSEGIAKDVELIVATPYTHLSEVARVVEGSGVALAAQNCSDKEAGAYTGEVSAAMLADMGVKYVIIGHSERREYYGEDNKILAAKMEQVYKNNLVPIYCIGETLSEREAGVQNEVVAKQLEEALFDFSEEQISKIILAYEPVWAIGTGLTATSQQAEEIHAYIREFMVAKFGAVANEMPILYGGSCKPSNAGEIFAEANVNGGLIGGASLNANDFIAIAKGF